MASSIGGIAYYVALHHNAHTDAAVLAEALCRALVAHGYEQGGWFARYRPHASD